MRSYFQQNVELGHITFLLHDSGNTVVGCQFRLHLQTLIHTIPIATSLHGSFETNWSLTIFALELLAAFYNRTDRCHSQICDTALFIKQHRAVTQGKKWEPLVLGLSTVTKTFQMKLCHECHIPEPRQLNVNNKAPCPEGWIYLNFKIPGKRVWVFQISPLLLRSSGLDVDAWVVVAVICRTSHVSMIIKQMRNEIHCGKPTRLQTHFNILSP